MDFDGFINLTRDRLSESHNDDIQVYRPDDRLTEDIETHIGDPHDRPLFPPDTRIKEHPGKLQDGAWTGVIG
jgi:hypothetical protein